MAHGGEGRVEGKVKVFQCCHQQELCLGQARLVLRTANGGESTAEQASRVPALTAVGRERASRRGCSANATLTLVKCGRTVALQTVN